MICAWSATKNKDYQSICFTVCLDHVSPFSQPTQVITLAGRDHIRLAGCGLWVEGDVSEWQIGLEVTNKHKCSLNVNSEAIALILVTSLAVSPMIINREESLCLSSNMRHVTPAPLTVWPASLASQQLGILSMCSKISSLLVLLVTQCPAL